MPPSRLAGAAKRRFSATSAAAVYCAIMKPEHHAAIAGEEGRQTAHQEGSPAGSMRRSEIAAATPPPRTARLSIARPSAAPTAMGPANAPSGDSGAPATAGLSVTLQVRDRRFRLPGRRRRGRRSTCGTALRLSGSWVRVPARNLPASGLSASQSRRLSPTAFRPGIGAEPRAIRQRHWPGCRGFRKSSPRLHRPRRRAFPCVRAPAPPDRWRTGFR